jgi:magnesium transporter
VIRVRRYHESGQVDEELDPEEVSECLGQRGALLWVDVESPTEEDVELLTKEFHVHHLAVEDLLERSPRPRLGRYSDHLLLVVRDACFEAGRVSSREIDLVFSDGWLISLRKGGEGDAAPAPVDEIVERFERQRHGEGATDEGFLLYVVLDTVVDRFFEVSEALEGRLDEAEEAIFAERPEAPGGGGGSSPHDRSVIERLYHLRQDLVVFRRAVAPLREALSPLLRREVSFIGEAALVHLRDVYDLVVRATEMVDAQRDLLNGALEAHLSIGANRMNLVMKRATSWGAILVSATLVAGIYGMNFDHMPELHWVFGYPFALAVMAVITVVLYRMFRQRDWL